jgi:hypothetical protein
VDAVPADPHRRTIRRVDNGAPDGVQDEIVADLGDLDCPGRDETGAVTRLTDLRVLLEDPHLQATEREIACDATPRWACADDENVENPADRPTSSSAPVSVKHGSAAEETTQAHSRSADAKGTIGLSDLSRIPPDAMTSCIACDAGPRLRGMGGRCPLVSSDLAMGDVARPKPVEGAVLAHVDSAAQLAPLSDYR